MMIGLAWTLPFLQPFHRFPLPGFYSEWLALALGLGAALALLRPEPSSRTELPAVALAPIGLAAVLGLQAALGRLVYAEQALTAVLYLLWAALLVVLGRRLHRELGLEQLAITLAWCLLAGGLLSAVAGLMQHLHVQGMPAWLVSPKVRSEVYGNLGQANHFAVYLAMGLASALYLHGRGRLAAGWMAACAALMLPPMALSGSRSIWAYLAIFLVLAAALWRIDRGPDARRFGVAALCLLPALAVAHGLATLTFFEPPPSAAPVVTSVERLFHAATGAGLRLQLWDLAWRMFVEAPLLGAGFGQFAWHHFVHAAGDPAIDPVVYRHAHNLVLHLLAETGAIGALIVGGAVVAWAAGLRGTRLSLEHCWLIAMLALLGVHSLLEFPLWYAYFLGIAAFLLGIGGRHAFELRTGAVRALAAIAIAWGCFNLAAVMAPYRAFERLVFLPQGAATRPVDDAGFARAIAGVLREPTLVPYVELAIAFGLPVSERDLTAKLMLSERAAHFAPVPIVADRYALLLAMAGRREEALAQLDRALRVYPAEAGRLVAELEALAARDRGRFEPLLELARSASRTHRRSPS